MITALVAVLVTIVAAGPSSLHYLWWPVAGVLVVHIVRSWRPVILHPWVRAVGGVALLLTLATCAPGHVVALAFVALPASTLARVGLRLHTRYTAR